MSQRKLMLSTQITLDGYVAGLEMWFNCVEIPARNRKSVMAVLMSLLFLLVLS